MNRRTLAVEAWEGKRRMVHAPPRELLQLVMQLPDVCLFAKHQAAHPILMVVPLLQLLAWAHPWGGRRHMVDMGTKPLHILADLHNLRWRRGMAGGDGDSCSCWHLFVVYHPVANRTCFISYLM